MISLDQLRYLLGIVGAGSFRKAAERLGISQPALSLSITRLEKELGIPVLQRSHHGVVTTPYGESILKDIQDALDSIDRIYEARDTALARQSGQLLIGVIPLVTHTILRPSLLTFRTQFPDTQIAIREAGSHAIVELLLQKEIELGVISTRNSDDALPPSLVSTQLLTTRFVLCMSAQNPLSRLAEIPPETARTQRLINYRTGYLVHDFMQSVFGPESARLSTLADSATDSIESSKWMAAAKLGVTVMAEIATNNDPDFQSGAMVARPIRDVDDSLQVYIVRRAGEELSATARAYIRLLRETSRLWPGKSGGNPRSGS